MAVFKVERKIADKLPKWAAGRMVDLNKSGNYSYMMEALPADSNQNPVEGYADTLEELRWQLAHYRKTFKRFGLDY